jgi:hypothetical protein
MHPPWKKKLTHMAPEKVNVPRTVCPTAVEAHLVRVPKVPDNEVPCRGTMKTGRILFDVELSDRASKLKYRTSTFRRMSLQASSVKLST